MQAEVVAVPTRGIERWLSQRLAGRLGSAPGRGDGVCANLDFPFPGTLIGGAVAAASGIDHDRDPWTPQRSLWPLIEVAAECAGEQWLAGRSGDLGAGAGAGAAGEAGAGGRRLSAARHLAALYDRYGVHRPELVTSWAAGDDGGVPPDDRWQAELWRRLRARIATPSPPERLADACACLQRDGMVVALPRRLSLFGLTRLPASYVDVLAALARHRDVHLFLLHPSPALWHRLEASFSRGPGLLPRRDDPERGGGGQPAARLVGPGRAGDAVGARCSRRNAGR